MMLSPLEIASDVKRDRIVLVAGLVVTSGVAWAHMIRMASDTSAAACHAAIASASSRSWAAADFATAAAMWTVMMLAMMLPVVSPWILVFSKVARERDLRPSPFPAVRAFLAGYGAVWLAYTLAAAAAQFVMQRVALVSGDSIVTNPLVAAGLLLAAGVYQWTPLRDACMSHCRSPLGFFLTTWREGRWGSVVMGAKHGLYCVGCCWAVMALSFVFGVMNLLWMALVTAFLLVEKVTSIGPWMSKMAGAALIACSLWMLIRSA